MLMKFNVYKSAAQVTVFSIVEKAVSFIYRIILSRSIGAEGLGIYQICLSVFAVFLTVAATGVPVTVSRLIAKNEALGNPDEKHSVVTSGVLCTLLFTVPAAIFLFVGKNTYSFLFPDANHVNVFLILVPTLILTSIYAVIRGSFWGNKQFLPYSLIELAEDVVMVACGCVLISFTDTAEEGAKAAIAAVAVSYVFSFALSLAWYFFTGGKIAKPKKQFKPLLLASLPVTAMRASTSVLNSCIATFLPALLSSFCGYTSEQALEIYGAVLGMSIPVLYAPNPLIGSIAVVVAPQMSENYYSNRTKQLKDNIEKTLKCAVLIATVLIPPAFTCGNDVGIFLYDNPLSGKIISDFAFIMLPSCLSMITATMLNSMHCETKTLIYFFIGTGAMLACIFGFTRPFGIYAYMIGTAANFIITAALNLRLLRKKCPNVKYLRYALRCIIGCAFACLFGKLLSNLCNGMSTIARIIICGGASSLFALVAFYSVELFSAKHLKKVFTK